MNGPIPNPASITILGGFLGAGKTSLLNHVLSSDHGLKIGVLVNDFGQVNVDASLVVGDDGDTMELTNGCVCCNIREDLMRALQTMLSRDDPPEHVLLETSGVSDPRAVLQTLETAEAGGWVDIDANVIVVDAANWLELSRRDRLLASGQVRSADILIVNKVDIAEPEVREKVEAKVRSLAPRARVMEAVQGEVPVGLLLGVHVHPASPASAASQAPHGPASHDASEAAPDDGEGADSGHDHHHDAEYETWTFRSEIPLASKKLRRAVEELPPEVFRAKGTVHLTDRPEHRAVLHVVGPRAELNLHGPWEGATPQTEIVVIAGAGSLDRERLQSTFAACEVSPEVAGPRGPMGTVLRWLRGRGDSPR